MKPATPVTSQIHTSHDTRSSFESVVSMRAGTVTALAQSMEFASATRRSRAAEVRSFQAARGLPPREPDPEEWIVLTVVPFSDGPMVHSAIEGAGIEAVMDEARLLPSHGLDRHRIVVRQRDVAQAEGILRDLGRMPPVDPFDAL